MIATVRKIVGVTYIELTEFRKPTLATREDKCADLTELVERKTTVVRKLVSRTETNVEGKKISDNCTESFQRSLLLFRVRK